MRKLSNKTAAIVLAAGLGKRMKSPTPKVLHLLGEKPLIVKTLSLLEDINIDQIIVVVGFKAELVQKALAGKSVDFAYQTHQLGTAHAAKSGLSKVRSDINNVVVLNGDDSAFYKPKTLKNLIKKHMTNKNTITFASVKVNNPQGLGRVLRKEDRPVAIIEEKDANEKQKLIKEINCGLYVFEKNWLVKNIKSVKKSAVSGEYYLVNLLSKAISQKKKVEAVKIKDPNEWHGINSPQELKEANRKIEFIGSKIHFMGIAGAGESAVASLSQSYGFNISGCDLEPKSSYVQNSKLDILKGHSPNHLKGVEKLIISPAVLKLYPNNAEIVYAKKNKIPVVSWQEFLGRILQNNKFVIAIAGGYGKSTTTAMIAKILEDANYDPTCVVGAKLLNWNRNFRFGHSKFFVCEADEYNDNFLNYKPDIAIILNVSWDHPDFFKSEEDLLNSYKKFTANIKKRGTLIVANQKKIIPIIQSARSDIKIIKIKDFKNLKLSLIGSFRKENANAAITATSEIGLDQEKAKESLRKFRGLSRRLELKGIINNSKIYDDYAVQPYTILSTTNALKEKYSKSNLVLVLEPHTFSRVETFFNDFAENLKKTKADKILITSVFGAREKGDKDFLSQKLVGSIGNRAKFTGSIFQTAKYLKKNIKTNDIILTMGAGDIYKIYDLLK